MNQFLEKSAEVIQTTVLPDTGLFDEPSTESAQFKMAVMGVRHILSLYSQLSNGKNVTESAQTVAMTSRDSRDRTRSDYFSPPQFLVELRMSILPTVRGLWESDVVDKAPSDVSEKLVDVIRTIAIADCEANALKRSDKAGSITKSHHKIFRINNDNLTSLLDYQYEPDLAIEALYRCNNSLVSALEYCREIQQEHRPRYPVPEGDVTPNAELSTSSRPRTSTSTGTETPDDHVSTPDNPALDSIPSLVQNTTQGTPPSPGSGFGHRADTATSRNIDLLVSQIHSANSPSLPNVGQSTAPPEQTVKEDHDFKHISVDDLNEERAAITEKLIDRCLDVINAHGEVTFEISDLITTVVDKSADPSTLRKVVGETLVIALMSFAGEEDLGRSGKKIAAYAHLLALLLRKNKLFYSAAVGELKDNLSTLLGFVKLSPNHSSDEPSPWIAHILLLVEMLLSEDARPPTLSWKAPLNENEDIQTPILEPFEPAVPADEQAQVLEAILEILPRIGKDESLAVSVLRILVILTRNREVAQTMGEKKNIQRLFVMAKQLSGSSTGRHESPLMLILRHIIEDDMTIKQIMRSEIKNYLESSKSQRQANDVTSYLKSLSHVSMRAPQLFIDVTNEMVKYSRWSYPGSDALSRSNTIALKESFGE